MSYLGFFFSENETEDEMTRTTKKKKIKIYIKKNPIDPKQRVNNNNDDTRRTDDSQCARTHTLTEVITLSRFRARARTTYAHKRTWYGPRVRVRRIHGTIPKPNEWYYFTHIIIYKIHIYINVYVFIYCILYFIIRHTVERLAGRAHENFYYGKKEPHENRQNLAVTSSHSLLAKLYKCVTAAAVNQLSSASAAVRRLLLLLLPTVKTIIIIAIICQK